MNISIDFHIVKYYNIGEKSEFLTYLFFCSGGDIVVYIVSDERIAVENFEQGKIYKVDFVDETVLYGVCVGIGSDFVMLSGDISGYIFPLTMQTASQVSSIELYDPTPPEPPVPWTNLLQYQTGVPGFEFNTTDTSLFSWYIEGEGVGDKTANLLPEPIAGTVESAGITIESDGDGLLYVHGTRESGSSPTINLKNSVTLNGSYYVHVRNVNNASGCAIVLRNGSQSILNFDITAKNTIATVTLNDATIDNIQVYVTMGRTIDTEMEISIEATSDTTAFEPYGYKIPILCNEHLTNIYLDAPLSEGEILYSTDIDTAIVTDIGDNELTVETTQQPTAMQIVYKIADR